MNSSGDMLGLVASTLRQKAPKVLGDEARRRGIPYPRFLETLPDNRKKGLMILRLMDARYTTGDYTHDDKDVGVLERVCNWLIEIHQTAAGHPVRPIVLKQGDMQARKPLDDGRWQNGVKRPKGSLYREIMAKLPELGAA